MKKTLYPLLAAALLTACSSDDAVGSPAADEVVDNTILLSASVSSATRAATTDDLQDTQFASGEAVRVDVYRNGAATPYAGGSYTTTSAAGAMTGSLYYSADGGAVDIEAYHPSSVAYNTTSFTVQSDQTTAAGYRQSDLMSATRLTGRYRGTVHELTFQHALSKVVVNLSAASGSKVEAADPTLSKLSKVVLSSTCLTAAVSKGRVTSASGTAGTIDITATDATTGAVLLSHVGLMVPQALAAGTPFITVTYDGSQLAYTLPEGKTFQTGRRYTYNLQLTGDAITLQGVTIDDWDAEATALNGQAERSK